MPSADRPKPTAPLGGMWQLSPRRKTSEATDAPGLVAEQLAHFGIDADDPLRRGVGAAGAATLRVPGGRRLALASHDAIDRHARPHRPHRLLQRQEVPLVPARQAARHAAEPAPPHATRAWATAARTLSAKGPYAVFDNVTAIFSATPVIARTATYIYACAEWIEDAFQGKELLLEIYSRLLNPTSVSLANYIVDLEAGPYAGEYFAWNFNSGMAAIDAVLSHVLGRDDVLITSRNIYGGAHQLIHDWYAKPANLAIAVETFDGYDAAELSQACWQRARREVRRPARRRPPGLRLSRIALQSARLRARRAGHLPRGPRDGPARDARRHGRHAVPHAGRCSAPTRPSGPTSSSTATPRTSPARGSVIAGVVIGRNEDMFIPKGETAGGVALERDAVLERVLRERGVPQRRRGVRSASRACARSKCGCSPSASTREILARVPRRAPGDQRALATRCRTNENSPLREKLMFLGLPAPLFTIDMAGVPREAFQRFFDSLGADVRPHDQPGAIEHDRQLPRADHAFRADADGPARGRHHARRRSASPSATKTRAT